MLKIFSALLFMMSINLCVSTDAWALTESRVPLEFAFERAELVSVVRIVEGAYSSPDVPRCRFKYRSVTLHAYKGEQPEVFFSEQQLSLGHSYLVVAGRSPCGEGYALVSPGHLSFFPVTPLGYDEVFGKQWVAFGSAGFVFDSSITVSADDYPVCRMRVGRDVISLCQTPPPVARFDDLDAFFRRLADADSREGVGTYDSDSANYSFEGGFNSRSQRRFEFPRGRPRGAPYRFYGCGL